MRKTLIRVIAIAIIVLLAVGTLYKKGKKNDLKKITVSEVAHSVLCTYVCCRCSWLF